MHCLKRLGEEVIARTFERRVVKLNVRVALLSRLTQHGLYRGACGHRGIAASGWWSSRCAFRLVQKSCNNLINRVKPVARFRNLRGR